MAVNQKDLIFALDIGTRSVIGVVGRYENEILQVLDVEVREHTKRAMVDGQIEDVDQVARVVASVKEALETRQSEPFHKVHIAAAGRALKTVPVSAVKSLDPDQMIHSETVAALEAEALQQAQEELQNQLDGMGEADFFCVGYSVVKYYLDGYPISTLLRHKGKTAQVDLIATFLPVQVVDSLTLCMKQNALQVASLTLEPIAAMNAVIPQELRIINLAIVDIGAGTSDIAISNEGSVVAYTMATVAGDEITEAIVKYLLVDFNTAERVKSQLSDPTAKISYTNILGGSMEAVAGEILDSIDAEIELLCEEITQRILTINGGAPAAVFVVGGGSKLPRLCDKIACKLGLDPAKVVVSSNNYMKRVVSAQVDVSSTEFVTPVGIALTAALLLQNGIHITVNGRDVAILKHGAVTVMDALQVGGIDTAQIMGRSGKSVTFELDGQKKTVRGGYPTPAAIFVNEVAASISTPIHAGDTVMVVPCIHGKDAKPVIADVVAPHEVFEVSWSGRPMQVGAKVLCNGKNAARDQPIHNQDVVVVHEILTLGALLEEVGLVQTEERYCVGEVAVTGAYRLKPDDVITAQEMDWKAPKEESPAEDAVSETIPVAQAIRVTINGAVKTLTPKVDQTPYQFLDMLNFVDMDPSKPQGNYIMKLNRCDASFLDLIADGDVVEIRWDHA